MRTCLGPLPPRLLLAGLSLLAASGAGLREARAQESDDARRIEARAACAAGQVEKGIGILARLFAETGDYTWVYNQGRCYQQNGRAAEAINRFREYLRRAQGLSAEDTREVQGFIRELEQAEAAKPAGSSSPSLAPPPVTSSPAASPSVATTSPPRRDEGTGEWSWQKKAGLGALIGAGGGLAMGVAFHLAREKRAHEFIDAGCGTDALDVGNCRHLHDRVKSAGVLAGVGYSAAIVLGGVGTYLFWFGSPADSGRATAARGVAVSCAPDLATAGLACAGRF
jgi:hypothetical protein